MPDRVQEACEACFEANQHDCSGFVRAVAKQLGVTINGLANEIVDTIRSSTEWRAVPDGTTAAARAAAGQLVIGGMRGDEQFEHSNHGHVVVVVDGPLAHGRYPTAYWGRLGGEGSKNETINWAWTEHDRDRVSYAEHDLPAPTAQT
jgi:hypothetical protein